MSKAIEIYNMYVWLEKANSDRITYRKKQLRTMIHLIIFPTFGYSLPRFHQPVRDCHRQLTIPGQFLHFEGHLKIFNEKKKNTF